MMPLPHNKFNLSSYQEVVKDLMEEIVIEYARTMKKTLLLRDMADESNDWKFIKMKLPIKREVKTIPQLGVVVIPTHDYFTDRAKLAEMHWYKSSEVVQVSKIMANKSYSFQEYKFLQTKDLKKPMELNFFFKTQQSHHNTVKQ
jgi:hypothetical protein